MVKTKVKVEQRKRIYIHNDILNAANHLRESVIRIQENNEPGITLHIIGALTMNAFAYEAQINFIGHKCVSNWKEREKFHKKLKKIFDKLDIKQNTSERPFSTMEKLKAFRDFIAHGKLVKSTKSMRM